MKSSDVVMAIDLLRVRLAYLGYRNIGSQRTELMIRTVLLQYICWSIFVLLHGLHRVGYIIHEHVDINSRIVHYGIYLDISWLSPQKGDFHCLCSFPQRVKYLLFVYNICVLYQVQVWGYMWHPTSKVLISNDFCLWLDRIFSLGALAELALKCACRQFRHRYIHGLTSSDFFERYSL